MQAQQSLITPAIVQLEIESTGLPAPEASKNATKTCKDAKQLFATLAYIEKASTICSFLEEGISDDDLPLSRTNSDEGSMLLKRTSGEPVEAFTGWDDEDMEDFDRIQWWMKAPIFEESEHKDLLSGNILPFIPLPSDEDVGESKQGGYSEVYAVRVHPAHHNFWESSSSEVRSRTFLLDTETNSKQKEEPLIAVKRLNSPDVKEFEKEREILTKLGARDHPHLIKLLATYHLDKRYHLMFPYANANLRKYWDDNPLPWFNKETLLWSVKQMTGIASGLVVIHNYRATIPLGVAGGFRKQKDAELRVREGEELFGRHGDIKPENILWFKHMHGVEDKMGVLQIADFGLGRFHGRESRSRVDPRTVQTSPTYEPPECKLRRSVSRAYDIWSLGCLYLEFVTWLLKGSAEIGSFSNVRGKTSSLGINEDNFFNTIHGGLDAEVREEVIEWVKELHQHPKCSSLLHELLDLVMNKMLVVDARSRIKAGILHERLIMMTKASEKDEKYLLDPVPLPPHRQEHDKTRSQSTSAVPGLQQPMEKRNIVTFSRDTTIIGPPVSPVQMDTRPRDLVLRSAGTPAYRLTPCKTWPTISPLESVGGPASSSSDANEE